MKYVLLAAVALCAFSSTAMAEKIVVYERDTEFDRKACDLVVDFSSYASGVDLMTKNKIQDYVQQEKGIYSIKSYPWGREGESSLCLKVRSNKTAEVFDQLKSMLPEDARAPTTVDNNIDVETYSNSYR